MIVLATEKYGLLENVKKIAGFNWHKSQFLLASQHVAGFLKWMTGCLQKITLILIQELICYYSNKVGNWRNF